VGAVAEAGGKRALPQKRAAQGRRRRSGQYMGATAEAGGTWAPLQKRATRAVADGSDGTRAPLQRRAAHDAEGFARRRPQSLA